MNDKEKILVIKLGALGDFIQAFGPIAAIRKNHKDAHIVIMTTEPYAELAKTCPYFDEIIIDQKPRWHDLKGWMSLALTLNECAPDRVYDLQNNDRTAMYLRLFSIKNKPEWVGVAKGASHRNSSKERTKGHALDGHKQTLALAGIKTVSVDPLEWMDLPIQKFGLKKPYVLLVPGCSPKHPQKKWPTESYARLAQLLAKTGYQPVLIGGKAEESLARDILRVCPQAIDLTAQTELGEISAMARGAAGAIGNDTGPIHLIAATQCPTLALFSSFSNLIKHQPKGKFARVLQTDNLETLSPEKVLKKFAPRQIPGNASRRVH